MIANAPEFGHPLLFCALNGSRIFKAPVNALGGGGENRATLLGVVANGDDIIEMLPGEFLNRLRAAA